MDLSLGTPALLFGAISLLMLAYTNRFLAIAALIRRLHDRYSGAHDPVVLRQIVHLRWRLRLIQAMQFLGAASFLGSLLTMGALLLAWPRAALALFVASLLLLMASLLLSMREIQASARALNLQLSDLEDDSTLRYPRIDPESPRPLP